jgi:ribonuclease HII
MKYPNLSEEKKLHKLGFNFIVGLDEVGRGPLAGPVVAGAVSLSSDFKIIKGINDSKKISEKQRKYFYEILTNNKDIKWGIGIVSEKVIDKINILEATKLAMLKAIEDLQKRAELEKIKTCADFLLIDGNFKLNFNEAEFTKNGFVVPKQKSIIKGDQKVFSVSCASIIAKIYRDNLMDKYHKKYPEYGFDKHKGYGTEMHIKNIKKFGPCEIHRKSFYPLNIF